MDKLTEATHNYKLNLWISRIKECRESGMTVANWCLQNQVSTKCYYYWMRKIKREAFDLLPPKHKDNVPVVNESRNPVFSQVNLIPAERQETGVGITIKLNEFSIEVKEGASESILQNTLLVIRNLC